MVRGIDCLQWTYGMELIGVIVFIRNDRTRGSFVDYVGRLREIYIKGCHQATVA